MKSYKPIIIKKGKKETPFQARILHFSMLNFMLGFVLSIGAIVLQEIIIEGLWHKIFIIYGVGIPIIFILTMVLSGYLTFISYLIIRFDYEVYKNGLESAITVKE